MIRVLVTGATGFCGSALVAALADAGYAVRAAVRRPPAPPLRAGVELSGFKVCWAGVEPSSPRPNRSSQSTFRHRKILLIS